MAQEQVIANQGTAEAGRGPGTQAQDLDRVKFDGWCEKCRWGIKEIFEESWCNKCEGRADSSPSGYCPFKTNYQDLGPTEQTPNQEMEFFIKEIGKAIGGLYIIAEGSEDRGTGYLISQVARSLSELESSMERFAKMFDPKSVK